jgi:hypothetical protein
MCVPFNFPGESNVFRINQTDRYQKFSLDLPPSLFSSRTVALFMMPDRIQDATPTAFEVKDRNVQHEHRIMPAALLTEVVPQLIS